MDLKFLKIILNVFTEKLTYENGTVGSNDLNLSPLFLVFVLSKVFGIFQLFEQAVFVISISKRHFATLGSFRHVTLPKLHFAIRALTLKLTKIRHLAKYIT